jgi:hypothetical protein
LIIEVFARFALSGEVTPGQLFKQAIVWFRLAGNAFVRLARVADDTLHVSISPRFFEIVGKFIVAHLADNEVALDQIADVLEHAYILLNL